MEEAILSHVLTGGGSVGTTLMLVYVAIQLHKRLTGGQRATESRIEIELRAIRKEVGEVKKEVVDLRNDGRDRERKNADDHAGIREAMGKIAGEMSALKGG